MIRKPRTKSPRTGSDAATGDERRIGLLGDRSADASVLTAGGDALTVVNLSEYAGDSAVFGSLRSDAADLMAVVEAASPAEAPRHDSPLILLAGRDEAGLAAVTQGFDRRHVDLDQSPADATLRAQLAPALALIVPAGREDEGRRFADAAGLPDLAVLTEGEAPGGLALALAQRLAFAEQDAGLARRTSALMRRESEGVNRRLHAIERFMYSLGGPRLSQALLWPVSESVATVGDIGEAVVQRLPIDSPGITAVDIWMPDADEDAARALSVAVEDSEGQRHPLGIDEISIGRDDGWLRFGSDEPLSGDRQDCRLVIEGAPAGLTFGLGPAVPDPVFALQGASATERVLALRVWRAAAGSTLNAAGSGTTFGRGRSEGFVARRIMPADLPRPTMLASPRSAKDHVSTAFWQQEDAILVHPSARGPVCAMLQRAPLTQITRLSAVVQAARRDGPALSFAIGVAPSGTITEDDWDEYLGTWLTLQPGTWGEVHSVPLRAPLSGRLCDIIIASAVAGGNSNENSWALFRAFRGVWKTAP